MRSCGQGHMGMRATVAQSSAPGAHWAVVLLVIVISVAAPGRSRLQLPAQPLSVEEHMRSKAVFCHYVAITNSPEEALPDRKDSPSAAGWELLSSQCVSGACHATLQLSSSSYRFQCSFPFSSSSYFILNTQEFNLCFPKSLLKVGRALCSIQMKLLSSTVFFSTR